MEDGGVEVEEDGMPGDDAGEEDQDQVTPPRPQPVTLEP